MVPEHFRVLASLLRVPVCPSIDERRLFLLEQRYGRRPDHLLLCWPAEPRTEDALTELPHRPEPVEEAGTHFDHVVGKIQAHTLRIVKIPERKICKQCELRSMCAGEGRFPWFEEEVVRVSDL